MRLGEIDRRQEDRLRGFDERERVAPAEYPFASLLDASTAFAHEHSEEFAQHLHGNENGQLRESIRQGDRPITTRIVVDALGVGEHVGVDGDPHQSSS